MNLLLIKNCYLGLVFLVLLGSCTQKTEEKEPTPIKEETQIELKTTEGPIVLTLYNETPQHRDNFIKLVKEQFYDSILFHRVIENFMAQAGDPQSKLENTDNVLGSTDLPYTVPFEVAPRAFHKRGALGAARNGNSARASSSTQFYIVQGKVQTDSTLQVAQGRINGWLAENAILNQSKNKDWATIYNKVASDQKTISADSMSLFRNRIDSLASDYKKMMTPYSFPQDHREVYKTIGGAPHLDQNYTVFGEVVSGLEILDRISAIPTDDSDKPLTDVRILSTKIIQ